MSGEELAYLGLLVGFLGGLLLLAGYVLVCGSRWWHVRHHQTAWRIMCDHCVREDYP